MKYALIFLFALFLSACSLKMWDPPNYQPDGESQFAGMGSSNDNSIGRFGKSAD